MTAIMALHPDTRVFHECAADGPGWQDVISDGRDGSITVDCSTYGFFEGAVVPDSQKVYSARNPVASAIAAARALEVPVDHNATAYLQRQIEEWVKLYSPYTILFDELFKVETIEALWNHLDLGPCPLSKVHQLCRMKIVRNDLEKFSVENVRKTAHEVLGASL